MEANQLSVVSSGKREILDCGSFYYIWIPMTPEEQAMFAPDMVNAAWRIKVSK